MTVGRSDRSAAPAAGRRRAVPPRRRRQGSLGVPRLPRPSLRSRFWRITALSTALALVVGWLVWYALTPEKLATSDKAVNASGVAGTPLYVGMYATTRDFGRTLRISGVKVHTTASTDLTVTPLLCRRGTVGVTTDPDQFCRDLLNPEGERLVGGDSIIVKIESATSALAVIDQVRIAYREDIRWDTQPAGSKQAIVMIAARPTPSGG